MSNAQAIIAAETATQAKRGRKPMLENKENVINALVAIQEGDEANMPTRRTIMQLIAAGHVVAKPKEREEGQVGRLGSVYEVTGKSRTWLANALRKRDADAVKAKAEEIETLRKIVAQRQAALDEAVAALAEAEAAEAVEPEQVEAATETVAEETTETQE